MNTLSKLIALILLLVAFTVTAAHAQLGSLVSSVSFGQDCSSGIGTGVTFDGTYLWYSCYTSPTDLFRADPTTGTVSASYGLNGGFGAIAYDATRNIIYAAPGKNFTSPETPAKVYSIQLDTNHNVTGFSTLFSFAAGDPNFGCGLSDGLAFDAGNLADPSDDSIYFGCHLSTMITRYNLAGVAQETFSWTGSGCYPTGLAVGGNILFQGSDTCDHVWAIDKTTKASQFNFSTQVATDSNQRDEGLTCDTTTFFPSLGKHVVWAKQALSPMRAYAFEIPLNSCGIGGNPPPNNTLACPLGQGYWKNHAGRWPVTTLVLGGRSYNQTQLLQILSTAPQGDASLILADQLIAAKLNLLNGSYSDPIASDLAHADAYLASVGVLPAGVAASSAAGQQMTATAANLNQYNKDVLTPYCTAKLP